MTWHDDPFSFCFKNLDLDVSDFQQHYEIASLGYFPVHSHFNLNFAILIAFEIILYPSDIILLNILYLLYLSQVAQQFKNQLVFYHLLFHI